MDLDDELRRMFANSGDHLDVPVRGDAEQTIVAGAQRVRRRRLAAMSAGGAAAVVVVVVAGIALINPTPETMPPAVPTSTTSSAPVETLAETPAPPEQTEIAPPPQALPSSPGGEAVPQEPSSDPVAGEPLGPMGFRELRMNMTLDEAQATGMVGPIDMPVPSEGCGQYPLVVDGADAGFVYFTQAEGLVIVAPDVPVHTVDGISIGWTIEQVDQMYPDFDVAEARDLGRSYVPVDGADGWVYRVGFVGDEVSELALQSVNQPCYE